MKSRNRKGAAVCRKAEPQNPASFLQRAGIFLLVLAVALLGGTARMPAQQSGQGTNAAPGGQQAQGQAQGQAVSGGGARRPGGTDGAPAPENASGSKANLINESQLVGLPLNGRSYSALATLEAGVSDPSSANASRGTGGGSLNVSGSRGSSNTFLLDGTNVLDTGNRSARSAAGVQLGTDSVLQVLVFSTTFTSEYGRGSGGVLNSITRSGSNDFHGALFEYLRNSTFDARNWVERDPNGKPAHPAPFKRNQFGFTVAGPIKKDKTYFMGSFEALRDRLSDTQLDTFIDSFARQGIIVDKNGVPRASACITPPCAPDGSLTNPYVIPATVKQYLSPAVMPVPNAELLGGGLAHNVGSQFLPTNENFFTIRVDHAFSDRDSIFARYSFDDATSDRGGGAFTFGSRVRSRQQYATLVGSHLFSTRLVSSFRIGFTRPVDATESVTNEQIVIPRALYFVPTAPQFGVLNVPGLVGFGPAGTSPEYNKMNSFQFAGDILAQRGPHGLKFGLAVDRYRWDVGSSRDQSGTWNFNSLESFLQGGPDGTSVTVALPGSDNSKAWRETLVGFYVQDEYKFRSNVQLSLGLRYEFTNLINDRLGRTSHLEDLLHDTKMTVGPLLDHNPSRGNLSPRIGVTWSPGGSRNTQVNAGFGIYFDQLLGYALDTQKNAAPYYSIGTNPTFDSRSTFPDAVAGASQIGVFPQQGLSLDYHDFTDTRVLRYEFGVQHRLPKQTNLQLSYVGARGNHVWRNYEANQFTAPVYNADGSYFFPAGLVPVNPAFRSGINVMASDAQSFYNSFLLTADTRFGRAVTLRASFTYSKSIDDASSIGTSASAQQYGLDRALDRSLSDFDNRKRLSTSFFYSSPVLKGRSGLMSVASQVVSGWRIGGIMSYRTSTPTTAKITVRRSGYLLSAVRPNLLPGQSNNPVHGPSIGCNNPDGSTFIEAGRKIAGPALFYDPCVFTIPPAGTVGNLGRNTLFGPSIVNLDVSLQRDFPLGGDRRLQFRTEIFNVANHTNFRTPTANSMQVFSGSGRFNTGVGQYVNTSTTSRQIQFALRLSF